MTAATRVPAVGGTRTVPEPDPIARDYLLLALRLDQQFPGFVDAYYGPQSLKAEVDLEPRRSPAALRDDAAALQARVPGEVDVPDRRAWLTAQLVAIEAQAAVLAGEPIPYLEHVARAFDFEPRRISDRVFDDAARQLDELLPAGDDLLSRIDAWDRGLEIPAERIEAVVDWLVERFRARSDHLFGVPAGERLSVAFVRAQPWTAFNWYDGGLRSRVDINLDRPAYLPGFVQAVAHETFPGHHLEHAWKEAALVEAGRLECSVMLANTPECFISEGLADLGFEFAASPPERPALLEEAFERARLPVAADPTRRRDVAQRAAALIAARDVLDSSRVNAAQMLHADGAPREEVVDYLVRVGRFPPAAAEQRLDFLEHPLWRTYVFVYSEGEQLLRRWVDAVADADRPARFARLLHEQLTPGAI